jgi:hypothetical protein
MAYFSSKQDRIERGGKVAADIACAVLLLGFAVVFFGWIGGTLAFLVLEAALIGVDYLVPDGDDAAGVVR